MAVPNVKWVTLIFFIIISPLAAFISDHALAAMFLPIGMLLYQNSLTREVPEDKELIRGALSKEQQEAEILFILSGQKRLSDAYLIEFSSFPSEKPEAWQLKLTLKEEGEYSYILLEIDKKTWLIRRAILFDWAGNKTEYRFTKIKTNVRFSKDVFELKVPPDVEIIEYQPEKKK